jgi:TRAF-type zinc finger
LYKYSISKKMMSSWSSLEKWPSSHSYHVQEIVELHENERAWIGGGFSKSGLLPNDRGRYSTTDGTLSWKTLPEAQNALLGRGWTYEDAVGKRRIEDPSLHHEEEEEDEAGEDEQTRDRNGDDADVATSSTNETSQQGGTSSTLSGEWFYARDFSAGAIANAKTTRNGALHWVRFRRITCTKVMDATQFAPLEVVSQCDYCDSLAVDQLSQKLLDVSTFITLVSGPACLTAAVAIPTKASIVALLDPSRYMVATDTGKTSIKAQGSSSSDQEGVETLEEHVKPGNNNNNNAAAAAAAAACPALVYLAALHKSLEQLADTVRNHPKHILSHVAVSFQKAQKDQNDDPVWIERSTAVTRLYFSKAERDAMAGWMIRALDRDDFQLHCNQQHCGQEICPFARTKCPNPQCPTMLSKIHLPHHDLECDYKLIRCEACGDETIPRQEYGHHLRSVCPLRDVNCPFARVGCSKVVSAQSLPSHVADDNTAHLLVLLDRILEMQTVIRDLNGKVQRLQAENQELTTQMQDNVQATKLVHIKATAMEKKIDTLDSTTKKEFKRLRGDINKKSIVK